MQESQCAANESKCKQPKTDPLQHWDHSKLGRHRLHGLVSRMVAYTPSPGKFFSECGRHHEKPASYRESRFSGLGTSAEKKTKGPNGGCVSSGPGVWTLVSWREPTPSSERGQHRNLAQPNKATFRESRLSGGILPCAYHGPSKSLRANVLG
jgi:hypothetical protein